MKKMLIGILAALVVLHACVEDRGAIPNTIDLTAPTGEKISNGMDELNKWTAEVVIEKFGKGKTFEVTNISYYNVKLGYAALIEFKVNNAHKGSYIIVKNPSTDAQGRVQQGDCIRWSGSCQGDACCTPNFDTGTMNYSCSCSGGGTGCSIALKCIEQAQ